MGCKGKFVSPDIVKGVAICTHRSREGCKNRYRGRLLVNRYRVEGVDKKVEGNVCVEINVCFRIVLKREGYGHTSR